ncbi:hypothetical protein, partial [Levilactobacillus zymae]|uniref:hypothetical protein n=1 Tax=Levilactobacillus zymae TaxID=267363 RepID=UPI000708C865
MEVSADSEALWLTTLVEASADSLADNWLNDFVEAEALAEAALMLASDWDVIDVETLPELAWSLTLASEPEISEAISEVDLDNSLILFNDCDNCDVDA